jgi:hypothetical protein
MTQIFVVSGTSQTSPADWNNSSNTVEGLGGGASGAFFLTTVAHATGGGGGEYRKIANFSVATPGTTAFNYTIGPGGNAVSTTVDGNDGTATTFNTSSLIANPGIKGTQGAGAHNGGAGGSLGTGAAANANGGRGGNMTGASGGGGSGGGGAGGATGAGNAGVDTASTATFIATAGGSGDAGAGGAGGLSTSGAGGNGTEWDASHGSGGGGGGNGSGAPAGGGGLYGGGGGGANDTAGTSGAGGQGILVLTYTPASSTPPFIPIDFGPPQRIPPQPDRSRQQSFDLSLLTGQDRLPNRQMDWRIAPLLPPQPDRSRQQSFDLKLLTGADKLPFRNLYPPPQVAFNPMGLRAFDQNGGQLLLTGQDKLPNRQMDWRVAPLLPPQPDRSRQQPFNLNLLIGKDQLPFRQMDWKVAPTWRPQPDTTRQQSVNIGLIGQDKLPFRNEVRPRQTRPWLPSTPDLNLLTTTLTTIVVQAPFNQSMWPMPRGPEYHTGLRAHPAQPSPGALLAPFVSPPWLLPSPAKQPPLPQFQFLPSFFPVVAVLPSNQSDWRLPRVANWTAPDASFSPFNIPAATPAVQQPGGGGSLTQPYFDALDRLFLADRRLRDRELKRYSDYRRDAEELKKAIQAAFDHAMGRKPELAAAIAEATPELLSSKKMDAAVVERSLDGVLRVLALLQEEVDRISEEDDLDVLMMVM